VSLLVRLTLAAWFTSAVAHERRHLGQIERVVTDPALVK